MRPAVDDEINAAWAEVNKARAEVERLRKALESIKTRCDRIVAGEFGGLEAALDMSNEARRALNPAALDEGDADAS